ncbi:MAG: hypothetical protein ACK41U_12425 [Paracoccus sp. (in: a-proteobacteria)]|uniref:hypothetical protein n=1 Tax=Paracoccus sp. TaxID=267 RepID=UPI003918AA71
MTRFDPFSGKPVPTPFRRPLTPPEADTVARNRHLGWDAGTVEEADDLRRAASRDAIRAAPDDLSRLAADQLRLRRRAHSSGMIHGATAALIVFAAGILLRVAINDHWPVVCDGTGSLIICGLRLVGVAS